MTAPIEDRVDQYRPIAVSHRSGLVESFHLGAGVVTRADGSLAGGVGAPSTAVYLRSALKMFQTDAMVAAGLDLAAPLLALVAASHSGEARHLAGVIAILERHGLGVDDLRNTPTLPYGATPKHASIVAGDEPTSLMQNCSGKHAGMLATCRLNGWPTDGYLAADHPLQRHLVAHVESLGAPVEHVGVDGCGAPTFVLPLDAASRALGRLARVDASVLHAMREHPDMVGGADRDVTEWMRTVPGLVVKDGAAGVMALVLLEGSLRGTAAVYKIADGSDDVRRAVAPEALRAMGVEVERLPDSSRVAVLGGGAEVGVIEPLAWSSAAG